MKSTLTDYKPLQRTGTYKPNFNLIMKRSYTVTIQENTFEVKMVFRTYDYKTNQVLKIFGREIESHKESEAKTPIKLDQFYVETN